jgi:thiamine-monophosphate kinase
MRELKPFIHGLIDTSDGLATDARHLSKMSRVKIVLESDGLPILPATKRICAERSIAPLEFVLGAGEDYELLFTSQHPVPVNVKGVKVTPIGSVKKGSGLWINHADKTLPVTVTGYDHLRTLVDGKTCY